MIVLQIILDDLPSRLVSCVDSVKKFCLNHKAEYVCITSKKQGEISIIAIQTGNCSFDNYAYNRTLSEAIRIDFCAKNNYVLYCDWDVFLSSGFEVPDKETFGSIPDAIFYNHKNTARYNDIKNDIKSEYFAGECILAKYLWPLMEKEKCHYFNQGTYKHLFEFNNQIRMHGCYNYTNHHRRII